MSNHFSQRFSYHHGYGTELRRVGPPRERKTLLRLRQAPYCSGPSFASYMSTRPPLQISWKDFSMSL